VPTKKPQKNQPFKAGFFMPEIYLPCPYAHPTAKKIACLLTSLDLE